MKTNKLKKALIFGAIALCLVVGLSCFLVFGLKDDPTFTVKMDDLTTSATTDASIDNKSKTLTINDMEKGDTLSFKLKMSNTTKFSYDYRLSIKTTENTQLASALEFEIHDNGEKEAIFGNSEMVLMKKSISNKVRSNIIEVKIKLPANAAEDFDGDSCKFKFQLASIVEGGEGDLDAEYTDAVDDTTLASALTKQDTTILLASKTDGYDIENDITVNKSVKILGQVGDNNTQTAINVAEGKALSVANGGSLEISNAVINGTIASAQTEQGGSSQLKAIAREDSDFTQNKIILNNVTIYGTEETITDGTYTDTKPAIVINEDTLLQIEGDVKVYGAVNGTAIGVAPDAALTITGDKLFAQGNGGYEYIANGTNDWKEACWYWNYDASLDDAATEDVDEALEKAKTDLAALSNDPDFINHVTNALSDNNPIKAKYLEATSGDGIGAIYTSSALGKLSIYDLKSLTAEGYGNRAFGIGGKTTKSIDIANTTIEKARGGVAITQVAGNDTWAKGSSIGGAAIGLGNERDWSNTDSDATVALNLNNVIIKAAYGGAKSAAIGGGIYSPVEVNITDSTISNVHGGHSGAGIGGGRYSENGNQPVEVNINNSRVTQVYGGGFAAGIGSGYSTDARRPDRDENATKTMASMTTININGISRIEAFGGVGAAGIGSGLNSSRVQGKIESSVNTYGTKSGGYGDLVLIRITSSSSKYDNQMGFEDGKYIWSYQIGELCGRYVYSYYIMNDGETPDPAKAVGSFHGVVSSPEDIGLGSIGGNWAANTGALYYDGTAKIVYDETTDTDKLANKEDNLTAEQVQAIVAAYNLANGTEIEYTEGMSLEENGIRLYIISGIADNSVKTNPEA